MRIRVVKRGDGLFDIVSERKHALGTWVEVARGTPLENVTAVFAEQIRTVRARKRPDRLGGEPT